MRTSNTLKQKAAALLRKIVADVKQNGLHKEHALASYLIVGTLGKTDRELARAFEPLYAEANASDDPQIAETFIDVHTEVANLLDGGAAQQYDEDDDLDAPADAHDIGAMLRQVANTTALTLTAGRQKFAGIREFAEAAVINGVTTAEALEEVYNDIKRKHAMMTDESLTDLGNALADAIDPLGANQQGTSRAAELAEAEAAMRECDALHEAIDTGTIPMGRVKALTLKTFRKLAELAARPGADLPQLVADLDELAHSACNVGLLDHDAYHALTREAVQGEPSNFNVAKLIGKVADLVEQGTTPADIKKPSPVDVSNDSAEKIVADLRANANEIADIWKQDDCYLGQYDRIAQNARAGSRITDRAVALGLITSDEVNDMMIAARLSGKTPADFINAVADAVTVADVTRTNRQGTQDRHVA